MSRHGIGKIAYYTPIPRLQFLTGLYMSAFTCQWSNVYYSFQQYLQHKPTWAGELYGWFNLKHHCLSLWFKYINNTRGNLSLLHHLHTSRYWLTQQSSLQFWTVALPVSSTHLLHTCSCGGPTRQWRRIVQMGNCIDSLVERNVNCYYYYGMFNN